MTAPSQAVSNFMRQQGFAEEPQDACDMHFEGLYFQPRIVFPLIMAAIAVQLVALAAAAGVHAAIGVVLFWNTLFPALNPFELAYNRWVAPVRGRAPLVPAPPPRRAAQGMAAAMNLGAAAFLVLGPLWPAWAFEALLVVAFSALLFGRFCAGAWVYHVCTGRVAFANSTLPWARR